ncbi:orotidine-5'-phosphate decarboxylase [Homoserinimonas sp. OAct 916]|uniref:orotidine-5'-phosphate decarboxylase n=1 Tax=Homoserinimonas sp. OAct 916 TaxID=2211450 RepID=UPI001E475FFC|nr:orotidine-5'-phosphate decarboxylase [Homoserinimonas sp. OAct 916]
MPAGAGANAMPNEAVPPQAFGSRLEAVFQNTGQLCVGIDPHSWLLENWSLPDTAAGAREFSLRVVEAAHGRVGIVKPQVAFFERFGSAGYQVMEQVVARARQAGLLVIADVKRGDVGSSVSAYADAWLSTGSPLEADAMTVSAYQGFGSLADACQIAARNGKGLFVLAATSNPEALVVQTAEVRQREHPAAGQSAGDRTPVERMSVARAIIDDVTGYNETHFPAALGSVGVVLGATAPLVTMGIDTASDTRLSHTPVLAPGFGHQGARVQTVGRVYGVMTPGVIVTESRSILGAGPDSLAQTIQIHADELAVALG